MHTSYITLIKDQTIEISILLLSKA